MRVNDVEVCAGCGHTQPWHTTYDGACTYEIQDADEAWMRCGCRRWRP